MNPEARIRELEAEVKDLTMRLSAIKVITQKIDPICSHKLQQLLDTLEGCRGEQ